jgi:hypothetical protein
MRTHYSRESEPFTPHPVMWQQQRDKPLGLWYEVDGDWRRWVEDERLDWLKDRTLHRLILGDENILKLRGAGGLDDFTEQYRVPSPDPLWLSSRIDWPRVADEYDGIEIAPYVWSRRLELSWYYGWDCASGCIWRPRGARLEPMRIESRPPHSESRGESERSTDERQ